jgi:hypothetical protein
VFFFRTLKHAVYILALYILALYVQAFKYRNDPSVLTCPIKNENLLQNNATENTHSRISQTQIPKIDQGE